MHSLFFHLCTDDSFTKIPQLYPKCLVRNGDLNSCLYDSVAKRFSRRDDICGLKGDLCNRLCEKKNSYNCGLLCPSLNV